MKKTKNFKKLLAFTLAEVLITLSILGVVAAITVPSLVNKNSERETITKLKKNYSILSDAFDTMVAEEGNSVERLMAQFDSGDYVDDRRNFVNNKFKKYFNVLKDCGIDTGNVCMSKSISYKRLHGVSMGTTTQFTTSTHYRLILKDGTLLAIGIYPNCDGERNTKDGDVIKTCGELLVDINGYKEPNRLGYDAFSFLMTKNGVVPESSPERCNKNGSHEWNGFGCTAWAIYKNNMDYKRKTISW